MFGLSKTDSPPSAPHGQRAYVVGDVHGMDGLLDDLLAQIERDLGERPIGKAVLVFVGDLIDRGPGSAAVLERLRTLNVPGLKTVFLLGNHEEVLLRLVGGELSLLDNWRWFGGTQCMESYGADPKAFAALEKDEAAAMIRALIPREHVEFLESFADTCRFGDYLFVHAGIRPGVDLESQLQSDLRWIRGPFLQDETSHGFVVVHGHTIVPDVHMTSNRIAIDTGAYRSGVLTALVLEGRERRLLKAESAGLLRTMAG